MTTRRGFITGLISFVAAPAIVRAESLMRVRPDRGLLTVYGRSPCMDAMTRLTWSEVPEAVGYDVFTSIPIKTWRTINIGMPYLKGSAPPDLRPPLSASRPAER